MSNLRVPNRYGRDLNDLNITTLFIRPLAGKLRHDEILSYFCAFGDVNKVLIRNKTKRSYGFVKFTVPKSAAKALGIEFHIIAGRRVELAVASDRHQDKITFLELNDDCILEILSIKCLSVIDLCSVAATNSRLREIASRVFRKEHKSCDINSLSVDKTTTAKLILMNFGSVIFDLQIRGETYFREWARKVLNYVINYCSNSLESLYLYRFHIPKNFTTEIRPMFNNLQKLTINRCILNGASKELFASCRSLVELEISTHKGAACILESTFPKLQRFKYDQAICNLDLLESFISRHSYLKALNIFYYCQNVTAPAINNLIFLEDLELESAEIDSELIRTLSQLKRLQVLRLNSCSELQNINQVDDLNQVTTLEIQSFDYVDLDIVLLVKRMSKLKYLSVLVDKLEIDFEKYLRIVDVVRRRPGRTRLTFELHSNLHNYENLRQDFSRNSDIVEMAIVRW